MQWRRLPTSCHFYSQHGSRKPLVQVESRDQTRLVSAEPQPNDGRSQNKSIVSGNAHYTDEQTTASRRLVFEKSPSLAEAIIVTYRRGGMSCVVYLAICFLIHWLKSFWSMPISFLRKAKKSSTVGFVLNARFNAS